MQGTISNEDLITRLKSRCGEELPLALLARIRKGEKLRIKLGLDPTAPDIHLGHMVILEALKDFLETGHKVILIVGDFTAAIGDPSGRNQTRPMLNEQEIRDNAQTYLSQIAMVLKGDLEVLYNSNWLQALNAADILRLLASSTVQQLLHREDFANRITSGSAIGVHELLYPFMQGYDSYFVKADVEVGGSDQLFNLHFGRSVQKFKNTPMQEILTFPLLIGLDGVQKMSKSKNNYIGISEPPNSQFGKIMSISDEMIEPYLRLVCGSTKEEITSILDKGARAAKAELGRMIVARLHSQIESLQAQEEFEKQFKRREIPSEIPKYTGTNRDLISVLFDSGMVSSRNEARRLIGQKGIRVNNEFADPGVTLQEGDIVSVGRRKYIQIDDGFGV